MADDAVEIARLRRRVQHLEDQLELMAMMATYGPAVDSLSIDEAASLWADDGVYDVSGAEPMEGREAIAVMLHAAPHLSLVGDGCAHVSTLPLIKVDGDVAVGIAYHGVYVRDRDAYRVIRLAASRWDWVRAQNGWKVRRRTHRVLDGSDDARELLRDALHEIQRNDSATDEPHR